MVSARDRPQELLITPSGFGAFYRSAFAIVTNGSASLLNGPPFGCCLARYRVIRLLLAQNTTHIVSTYIITPSIQFGDYRYRSDTALLIKSTPTTSELVSPYSKFGGNYMAFLQGVWTIPTARPSELELFRGVASAICTFSELFWYARHAVNVSLIFLLEALSSPNPLLS